MAATTAGSGYSYVLYTDTSGSAQIGFTFGFSYIDVSHLKVSVNGVRKYKDTDWTLAEAGLIQFNTAPAASADAQIKIWRSTPKASKLVTFADGSVFTAADINTIDTQLLYLMQEALDAFQTGVFNVDSTGPGAGYGGDGSVSVDGTGDTNDTGTTGLSKANSIVFVNGIFVDPSDYDFNSDGSTLTFATGLVSAGDRITIRNVLGGGAVTTIGVGTVDTDGIADESITNAKIADGAVEYQHLKSTPSTSYANWSSPQEGDPVADMLRNLNARVETLESASGAQVGKQETTYSGLSSSTYSTFNFTFSFNPDYAIVIHNKGAASTPATVGGYCYYVSGSEIFDGIDYGGGSDDGTIGRSLSGNSVTVRLKGESNISSGRIIVIAFKE